MKGTLLTNSRRTKMSSDNTEQSEVLELFEPFDDEWKSATRSIRIDGTVTSVRLENFYWRVLAEIAEQEGLQVPQVMTQLSKAAKSGETKHTNFTSFVRVCCGRYLNRLGSENKSSDTNTSEGAPGVLETNEPAQGTKENVVTSEVAPSTSAAEIDPVEDNNGLPQT